MAGTPPEPRRPKYFIALRSARIKWRLDRTHGASYRKQKAAIQRHFMIKRLEEVPAPVRRTVGRMRDGNKLAPRTYWKGMTESTVILAIRAGHY